ncbi:transposase [Lusitaniella coriacea LEGE 07157]|uniref:Transposase n=1 Tax=Lusitaniella coriacea LEGE 07157 TaxID=945747 RepID=A0A8J7E3V0_9CYAN|nr:transposase [Lusitaniella coriacea]MBE9118154.1 transposase [Lusitaniella coriacea LEGE 07157]
MEYRRSKTEGGTYFFTVVTYSRKRFLGLHKNVDLLRDAFHYVLHRHPCEIESCVVLPDHFHCILTLPLGDSNFSTRLRLLKSYFSRHLENEPCEAITKSRKNKQEKMVWQRRFWEHEIRDEQDFINHVEYIHYNPVKHGLVQCPKDWQYSSFHRYVKKEIYDLNWGSNQEMQFSPIIGQE